MYKNGEENLENKGVSFVSSDEKTYYKAILIKTVWVS